MAEERKGFTTRDSRIRANHYLLRAITQLWDQYPDMRFGQLVKNLSREQDGFADTWEWKHGQWRERVEKAWDDWAQTTGRAD